MQLINIGRVAMVVLVAGTSHLSGQAKGEEKSIPIKEAGVEPRSGLDISISEGPKRRHVASLYYLAMDANGSGRRITQEGWMTEEGEDMTSDTILHEDCSMYPNGTDRQPYAFGCHVPRPFAHKMRSPTFMVHEVAFSNTSGDYAYPLDFRQPLRVFLDVTNYAIHQFAAIRAEVSIYRRKTGWMGCGWIYLPTFGSMDNLEICDDEDNNSNCPVYPGRQLLEVKVVPNRLFAGLIKLVHDPHIPYQVKLRLVNNLQPGQELLCLIFQARMKL